MKKVFMGMITLLVLIGCSNDEEAEVVHVPVIGDEPEEEQVELPNSITVPIQNNEDDLTISLNNIPILAYYLGNADQEIQPLIDEFQATQLTDVENNSLYVLSYACQKTTQHCSYLFIKKSEEEETIIPVTDLARYGSYQLSPDNEKVMLHFKRVKSEEYYTSQIHVIDLKETELLALKNEDLTDDVLHYNYPIYGMEWVDDDKVQIQIPVQSGDDEMINQVPNETNPKQVVIFEM